MSGQDHNRLPQLIRRLIELTDYILRGIVITRWTGAVLIIGFCLWYFSEIFTYLIIALVISSILRTPTNYVNQISFYGLKVPRFIAIITSFTLFIGLISLFVTLFIPLIQTQIENLQEVKELNVLIEKPIGQVEEFWRHYIDETLTKGDFMGRITTWWNEVASKEQSLGMLTELSSIVGKVVIGSIAVTFITFFFLYEKGAMRRYFISLIPNRYFEVSIVAVNKVERLLSNYLFGLLIQMIAIFSVASIGLMMAGVKYSITIAAFAAVANVIPFLGPILGATFGILVSMAVMVTNNAMGGSIAEIPAQDYIFLLTKILLVFGVVQLTDNILLQPLIFSRSVKAHPLEIFLIVFVGANIAGAIGMIASIPTYTLIKVTFTELYGGYKQYQIFRRQ